MKRKPKKNAKRAQTLMPIPGLLDHFRERNICRVPGRFVYSVDENGHLQGTRRTEVSGIPLPADLEILCGREAKTVSQYMEWSLGSDAEQWSAREDLSLPIRVEHVLFFEEQIAEALETGFRLALLRYAEDLKAVPEAAAMLKKMKRGSKKGGAARRAKAEPTHKAIRKRFRELRKSVPKKTARYLRVGNEFGISDRHVARIVDGID